MKTRKGGPLLGLRVVMLPSKMATKLMGMILADNGATVVELQSGASEVEPGWDRAESVWRRGKMLVSGTERASEFVARADAFVTDLDEAALTDIGLGLEALGERHPELVRVLITGYGQGSESSGDDWSETLLWARMGFFQRQHGYREGPKMPTFLAGTYGTAFHAITAMLAAIHVRSRGGIGQLVETSIADGLIAQQAMFWYWTERDGASDELIDIRKGGMGRLVLEAYQCADTEWVHIHSGSKGGFSRLMALAGLQEKIPPIPTDAASEIGQPIEDWQLELIHETLPALFATKTRAEWLPILRGLDIPSMPDSFAGEVFIDPQSIENQLSALVDLPSGEVVRAAGAVLKFADTPAVPATVAERHVSADEALTEFAPIDARAASSRPRPRMVDGRYPLAGIKVLDLGIYFAAPFSARLLADLGADVIKIENLAGCPMRPISNGRYFNAANHHKRTLALNLKKPEARGVMERLIASSDILQHNLRPGVLEGLGFGYEDVRDINPRLIYSHLSAFGSIGPYRGLPGFEPLSSAISGIMMRHEDAQFVGPHVAIGGMDPGNGLLSAAGLMMALYRRELTGVGQFVECPQLGSAILSTAETVIRQDGTIEDPLRVDEEQFGSAWWRRLYACRDGWIVIEASRASARAALLEASGADEADAIERIAEWCAKRGVDDAVQALRAMHVPVEPMGPSYTHAGFFFDEEQVRLGRVLEFKDPKWGVYRDLGQFARFSRSRTRGVEDGFLAPPLGHSTREILAECGYSDGEIAELISERVVGCPA